MKEEELIKKIKRLLEETQKGKVKWKVNVQTTEYNENKYIEEVDGVKWSIDEIYVNYYCEHNNEVFNMITYEMIKNDGVNTSTNTFVFFPPSGIRYFNLRTLLPYSITSSSMTVQSIHMLWNYLLEHAKKNTSVVTLDASPAEINIEEDLSVLNEENK